MPKLSELMNLKGRTAVVTGATGHIGRVLCETLAEQGADIVLVDRPGSDFAAVAESLAAWNVQRQSIACDLEQESDRANLIKQLLDTQRVNVLINNAAFVGTSNLAGWVTAFEQQTTETWRRAIEVNLTAVFDLVKGLAPAMKRSAGASVINIGSIYGICGPDYSIYEGTTAGNPAAYAASKGGLIQLTRWMATTLAPGVRVNAITPGGVFRNQPESLVSRYSAKTPLGRMASENDFRGAAAYLASDMSAYVTGQNLVVDGGWSVW